MIMRIFMVIVILIFALIEKSSTACTEQGVSPNPNDDSCQTYIFCFRLSDGVFIEKLYPCPNGTRFDPSKESCDKNFECVAPQTTLSTTTEAAKNKFKCTAQGRFPDENDETCTHYFFCYYLPSGKYIMRDYTCPPESKFNPRLQTCTATYECNVNSPTITSISTTRSPKSFNCIAQGRFPVEEDVTCRSYHQCLYLSDGGFTEQIYLCPSVLKFDPKTQSCNSNYQCSPSSPPSTTANNIFDCPSAGRFPDDRDTTCKAYFYCVYLPNGKLGFQIFNCPGGEEFDPQLRSCSSTYRCNDSTSSFTTPPTTITTRDLNCIQQGRFPIKEDETCQTYYYCLYLADGGFYQQYLICPSGLKFDPKTQSCISNYQCLQPSPVVPTPRSNDFKCPSIGRFADYTDETCKTYFYCVHLSDEEIRFQIFKCRESEYFDPKLQVCSKTYKCSAQDSTTNEVTTTFSILTTPPVEKTTVSYLNTATDENTKKGISTDTFSNISTVMTKVTGDLTTMNVTFSIPTFITTDDGNIICESVGNFPDLTDETCESYFVCSPSPNGELRAAKKTCEFNELFDPNFRKCSSTYTCHGESGCTSTGIPIQFSSSQPEQTQNSDFTTYVDTPALSTNDDTNIDESTVSSTLGNISTDIPTISTSILDVSKTTRIYTSDGTSEFDNDLCKTVGRFPVIEDKTCKSYYLCAVGPNGYISFRYRCVSGDSFDPILQKCSTNSTCDPGSTSKIPLERL